MHSRLTSIQNLSQVSKTSANGFAATVDGNEDNTDENEYNVSPFTVTEHSLKELHRYYGDVRPEFTRTKNPTNARVGDRRKILLPAADGRHPGKNNEERIYDFLTLRDWDKKYGFWTLD